MGTDMNRYNPENQTMLEDYVSQQVRDGSYDLDANMALLKLYQIYPDMDKNVKRALEIHKLLEKCRFGKFWEELQAEHDMIIEFEGFEDAIRVYICGVVAASFQRLSLENLKEFLGVA